MRDRNCVCVCVHFLYRFASAERFVVCHAPRCFRLLPLDAAPTFSFAIRHISSFVSVKERQRQPTDAGRGATRGDEGGKKPGKTIQARGKSRHVRGGARPLPLVLADCFLNRKIFLGRVARPKTRNDMPLGPGEFHEFGGGRGASERAR